MQQHCPLQLRRCRRFVLLRLGRLHQRLRTVRVLLSQPSYREHNDRRRYLRRPKHDDHVQLPIELESTGDRCAEHRGLPVSLVGRHRWPGRDGFDHLQYESNDPGRAGWVHWKYQRKWIRCFE